MAKPFDHLSNKERLSLTPARDFMTTDVVTLSIGTTIEEAIQALALNRVSGVPITDEKKNLIGVISEYDLLVQAASKTLSDPIEFISDVQSISPDTVLKDILVLMYKEKFKRIPVTNDDNRLLGIVSRIDILKTLGRGVE